ncbi:hypothetical protein [Rhizobacter fulvus]
MTHHEFVERIQAVLEGAASPEEQRELEQRLAADAAARAEFAQWQRLFVALDRVPQASPPEGLVASITAAAAPHFSTSREANQLFDRDDVIGYRAPEHRSARSWLRATIRPHDRPGPHQERENMSEQARTGSQRRLWAGGAVAVLAIGVALIAFDYPPKSQDVTGTIAPAERYRAPQATSEPVKLGDQTIAQLMQNDGFDKAIKDPQMQSLSQDASFRMLAQVLARSPDASRTMLGNIEAARATVENQALAKMMLENVAASRIALEAVAADKTATAAVREAAMVAALTAAAERTQSADARVNLSVAQRTDLARAMAEKMDASRQILQSVEASRMAMSTPAVAQAVLANVEASRVLMSTDASRVPSKAEAALMLQRVEASKAQLERARMDRSVAERVAQ